MESSFSGPAPTGNLSKEIYMSKLNRKAVIKFDIPDAWEKWSINIVEDSPEEITYDWLMSNLDKWEWFDIVDRGGEDMKDMDIRVL